MKISNYNMELNSNSTFKSVDSEQSNLKIWKNISDTSNQKQVDSGIVLNLSDEGKQLSIQTSTSNESSKVNSLSDDEALDKDDLKLKLLYQFIYALTGKRLKFKKLELPDNIQVSNLNIPNVKESPSITSTSVASNQQIPMSVGWGINYNYNHSYMEESKVSFCAKGAVKTSDGREIELEYNLNMTRTFYSQTSISFKAGDALLDPIVINLGNSPASLSGKKISFDINIDGNKEDISLPDSSSGFLVLDKNNNGRIDDGNELFGPQTNNGFYELSKYDIDNNGWIDENDPIYNNLQIWQHDDNGNSSLIAIGKAGVGAIYLQSAQTEFKYADNQNTTQGVLRETGIYLRENGTVGTIQHIDLAI